MTPFRLRRYNLVSYEFALDLEHSVPPWGSIHPEPMLPLAVLINRDIKTVSRDISLRDAARLMRDKRVGSLLVKDQGDYIGIVSETDIIRRGMAEGLDPDHVAVHSIMSSPIITLDINRTAVDANSMMSERGIRHLAITDQGHIIGVLSVRDLLVYFKNHF